MPAQIAAKLDSHLFSSASSSSSSSSSSSGTTTSSSRHSSLDSCSATPLDVPPLRLQSSSRHTLNTDKYDKYEKQEKFPPHDIRRFGNLTDPGYHPDQNCGVIKDGRPCKRSLGCKLHTLSERRAVNDRRQPFDTLLKEFKRTRKAKKSVSDENPLSNVIEISPTSSSSADSSLTPPSPIVMQSISDQQARLIRSQEQEHRKRKRSKHEEASLQLQKAVQQKVHAKHMAIEEAQRVRDLLPPQQTVLPSTAADMLARHFQHKNPNTELTDTIITMDPNTHTVRVSVSGKVLPRIANQDPLASLQELGALMQEPVDMNVPLSVITALGNAPATLLDPRVNHIFQSQMSGGNQADTFVPPDLADRLPHRCSEPLPPRNEDIELVAEARTRRGLNVMPLLEEQTREAERRRISKVCFLFIFVRKHLNFEYFRPHLLPSQPSSSFQWLKSVRFQ